MALGRMGLRGHPMSFWPLGQSRILPQAMGLVSPILKEKLFVREVNTLAAEI